MHWLERHWQRRTAVSRMLFPLSWIFGALAAIRRKLYRAGILRAISLPAPVAVVGNITAGGAGKTPLIVHFAETLRRQGWRPGIVSRGYGGTAKGPRPVTADSDPGEAGDEPVLLARRAACPIWVGRDRVAAAQALLAAHPECDAILSDDGLQHYRLARNAEIAVVDGRRGFGNGWLLPAGPLREPIGRLRQADAVAVQDSDDIPPAGWPAGLGSYAMRLEGTEFVNLADPLMRVGPGHFSGQRLWALAGIGAPERFFRHLERLGLDFSPCSFPDHYRYRADDLRFPDASAVLMTEKDGVKCRGFVDERFWFLPVSAVVDPRLDEILLACLKRK